MHFLPPILASHPFPCLLSIVGHQHREQCRQHRYSGTQHLNPVQKHFGTGLGSPIFTHIATFVLLLVFLVFYYAAISAVLGIRIRNQIQIRRIVLGLPDPLVRGTDPDPSLFF